MSYIRDQYNTSYSSFSQRGYNSQGGSSDVQFNQNQAAGAYPWGSTSGHANSTSGQESYGEYDYSSGYGENYSESKYNEDGTGGFESNYEDGYGKEWQGGENNSSMQWQGGENDRSMQWQGRENDSGMQWQGRENDSGMQWQGGENDSSMQWQGWENDSGMQWQGGQGNSVGRGIGRGAGRRMGSGNASTIGVVNMRNWTVGSDGDRGGGTSYGRGVARGSSSGIVLVGRDSGRKDSFMNSRGTGRNDGVDRGSSRFGRGGRAGNTIRIVGSGGDKGGSSQDLSSLDSFGQSSKSNRPVISPSASLQVLIEKWQAFAKGFANCGNAISNMECSLRASKVSLLQLNFDCKFLTKCNNYNIFTGTLNVSKLVNNTPKETIFLARGQGANRESAKMDCYEKACNLLLKSSVETIMSQEDCGEKLVKQDVLLHYKNNRKDLLDFLKNSCKAEDTPTKGAGRPSQAEGPSGVRGSASKRNNTRTAGPVPKRARVLSFVGEMIENKNFSLAPTKKIDLLMNPADPLSDKLQRLKQLLKEEGITKLHIVPKIDQLAHKVAMHIQNVYRFEDRPILGFEDRMPVHCEIYFDDVFMSRGAADFKRNIAMQNAYNSLATLLYKQPPKVLANNPRIWHPNMALDRDIYAVVTKWQENDNDSLLTSNLANMRQMMQANPDVTLSIDKMVLTEHESDKDIDNAFRSLELSATRNLMLLECEIVRNQDLTFTCTLSMQGQILARRIHSTKNGAKRLCSEDIITEMKKSHDVIYVKMEMVGKVITKEELLLSAAKKKAKGEPPGKIFKKIEHRDDSLTAGERQKQEGKLEERENLPENINARPLFPWIAAAMYDILDEYYQKITLEDLILVVSDMPKSQRDIVSSCAAKMGLRMVTKSKNSFEGPTLRRTVIAQDMTKILQLHGGESGRYKLVSCKNPLTEEELEDFRSQCLEQHSKLVEARINDNPDADLEPIAAKTELSPPTASHDVSFVDRAFSDKPYSQYPKSTSTEIPYRNPQMPRPPSSDAPRFPPRGPIHPAIRRGGPPSRPLMAPGPRPLMDPYFLGRRPFNRY